MENNYIYFKKNEDKQFNINEMTRYVNEKQEIDKFLEKKITPFIKNKNLNVLDACCGIGHISYLLNKISPKSTFLGIDQTTYLIEEARMLCEYDNNIKFEVGDMYNISQRYNKTFDISILWKTLSWLPYYEDMIKSLINVTKTHIFISSLFYDGNIDFQIKVREFEKEAGKHRFNSFYNVYSLYKFEKFVYGLGAKNIKSYNFNIEIDINKPPINQMGTYTLKTDSGKRIQISGTVIMLWKIIRIDL